MNIKNNILAASCIAAMAFAGVSCDKDVSGQNTLPASEPASVEFGVYSNSLGATRASSLDAVGVQNSGIGVFALHTGNRKVADYLDAKLGYEPNFMSNQELVYSSIGWTYSPVKYWPNAAGDKVSFYAYAPYTEYFDDSANAVSPNSNLILNDVRPSTDYGVRLVLGYDYMGPGIEYFVPDDPTQGVDLMWGASSSDTDACANIDMEKPSGASAAPVKFYMRHALSRLDFDIQVFSDATVGSATNNAIPDNTTIKVRSVSLVGNFIKNATLRLYDGTWNLASSSVGVISFNEGKGQFSDEVEAGFTGSDTQSNAVPLLAGSAADKNNYIMLVPGTKFCIEIVYDIITEDPSNPDNSSTITNKIFSTDVNSLGETDGYFTLEQGKAYKFNLMIGLVSVAFDVDSADWTDTTASTIDL